MNARTKLTVFDFYHFTLLPKNLNPGRVVEARLSGVNRFGGKISSTHQYLSNISAKLQSDSNLYSSKDIRRTVYKYLKITYEDALHEFDENTCS